MKKKFNRRARLVIYLEQEELEGMQSYAPDGRLSEWARSVLIDHSAPKATTRARGRFAHLPVVGGEKGIPE